MQNTKGGSMSNHAASKASERHTAAVAEKRKLLPEIQHWIESSNRCMAEMEDTMAALKSAKALAKRDIHMARASVEKKLKELEADAEIRMATLVQAEEDTLLKAQRRLMHQKQRLESTEASLQADCAGVELRKHIEDAKARLAESRQSIITSKRHYMPSTVEFRLHEELVPFVNGDRNLGKTQIKSAKGIVIRSSDHTGTHKGTLDNKEKPSRTDPRKNISHMHLNGEATDKLNTQNNNTSAIDKRADQPDENEHWFVNGASNNMVSNQSNPLKPKGNLNELTKLKTERIVYKQAEKQLQEAIDSNSTQRRIGGAYTGNGVKVKDDTVDLWVSTSIQGDLRSLPELERHDYKPEMKLLNDTEDLKYEGLGQEHNTKTQKREKRNVSYAEYTTIKEITMIEDDTPVGRPCPNEGFDDGFVIPEHWRGTRAGSRNSKSSSNSTGGKSHRSSSSTARSRRHTAVSDSWQSMIYSESRENSPRSVSRTQPNPNFRRGPKEARSLENLHSQRYSSNSSVSLSSISYKPSSAHSSGPKHVVPPDTWQSSSYFAYTARFHTKKHPENTDLCRLTGIVVLDNGQIVISDINHLRVMLFGPDFTYLSELECPSPCGLCVVKGNTVAVTLFHNRKLQLLKAHMLHLERRKEVYVDCPETLYAVKYSQGFFYVLCFAGHVHVMEDTGIEVRVLETGFGCGMARNLELDARRAMLYVSSVEHVTCFLYTGNKCWQFTAKTNNKTFSPGAIVLHNDRLFVTDWGNHRVLELSLDGTFVRDVITDNLEFPNVMAVQQSSGYMFVTQSNIFRQEARSRSVKVFSIK